MSDLPHSDTDLKSLYRTRFQANLEYRKRVWQTLTAKFFSKWVRPDSTVLDLGCGYCEFVNHIHARKKFGMDLNPDAAVQAARDVEIIGQDCSEPWPVAENSLDVVFTSNFFEHLPTKVHLERTLQQVWRALKPGGALIAMGPNIRHCPAYWDFFDHHIALTERSLAEILVKCGFNVEVSHDRFLPYTMSGKRERPIWMLEMYLRLPLAWPLFGKQFLVIARKR